MGEIQNYYQICFTHFFPAWFFASMMTSFSPPFLTGETTSSPWGFRRHQGNITLRSRSQTNVCHGHTVAVLLPVIQRVISYTWCQDGKSLHSVTVTTAGESLPERKSEHGRVQAITFLLQTPPQASLLGHTQHHANQAPGLQQP